MSMPARVPKCAPLTNETKVSHEVRTDEGANAVSVHDESVGVSE